MPKRGGQSSRSHSDSYFEHDDRAELRRVSFKRSRKNWGAAPQTVRLINNFRDTDVDMGSGQSQFRGSGGGGVWRRGQNTFKLPPRGGRGRQHSPIPPRVVRQVPTSAYYWYKIILPYGGNYDKNWVIESLIAAVAPDTFTAISYTTLQTKETFFYIDDHKIASKLANLNRRIPTQDGYKLAIVVRPHNPVVNVDDNLKDCLKLAMNKRFNPDTNALNLSKLHLDPDLVHKFVPLNTKNVLSAVLNIVTDSCRTLHALDLSHNMMFNLEGIKPYVGSLSHLRILHLANNRLNHVSCLDPLKGLDLQDLLMDSNPVCAKYEDQGAYVSDVRKRLPKLLKLDGVVLPPPILFDVEKTELPRSRGSFLCSNDGKDMARQFLEQYFSIFDSTNRNLLKDAYHDKAMVSMTVLQPHGYSSGQGNKDKAMLGPYMSYNRNLKRTTDLDRRIQNLMCGHTEILKFLSNFPGTQHDPLSFAVDLLLFTPQLIQICVNGVFREMRSSNNAPMRAFNRCLVIVPQGQGFCIVNETLTISNATNAQSGAAFKTNYTAPAASPAVAPVPATPVVTLPVADNEMKRQMVAHLAKVSGMNLSWSEKCLNETNWNIDQALLVFTELHRQGTIPAEAFVQ